MTVNNGNSFVMLIQIARKIWYNLSPSFGLSFVFEEKERFFPGSVWKLFTSIQKLKISEQFNSVVSVQSENFLLHTDDLIFRLLRIRIRYTIVNLFYVILLCIRKLCYLSLWFFSSKEIYFLKQRHFFYKSHPNKERKQKFSCFF